MNATDRVVTVPVRGLVVLMGASGAGKTTFAARHFASTEVLSSDAFRAMVGDDERDQSATPAAFDILTRVLAHRLRRGRLSVVDATNASSSDRRTLLRLAAAARRPAVAIVLDLPEGICQERNTRRVGRTVDRAVVRRHVEGIREALSEPGRLIAEGFVAVHVLDDDAAIGAVRVVRDGSFTRPGVAATRECGAPDEISRRRSAPRGRTA